MITFLYLSIILLFIIPIYSDSLVRIIPLGILDTELHMDYNSVVDPLEGSLGRASFVTQNIDLIVSLASLYYRTVTVPRALG